CKRPSRKALDRGGGGSTLCGDLFQSAEFFPAVSSFSLRCVSLSALQASMCSLRTSGRNNSETLPTREDERFLNEGVLYWRTHFYRRSHVQRLTTASCPEHAAANPAQHRWYRDGPHRPAGRRKHPHHQG